MQQLADRMAEHAVQGSDYESFKEWALKSGWYNWKESKDLSVWFAPFGKLNMTLSDGVILTATVNG